ncbi:hypothetical protein [Massilia sp. TWR1-2-2]
MRRHRSRLHQRAAQHRVAIVDVWSVHALETSARVSAYAAAKAALLSLTR